jgi:hypothetical protein
MAKEEDSNIDKIFNEMMSNNSIEDVNDLNKFSTIKELIHMQESLMESLLNVNSLIYSMYTDSEYVISEEVTELLGPLYKISEDFIAEMIELNVIFELSQHLEDEDDESEEEDYDGETD